MPSRLLAIVTLFCLVLRSALPAQAATSPTYVKSLAAWYDASTDANLTFANTAVSAWSDKSGNGRTLAQATSANQPSYTAGSINGLSALTFNGTSTYLVSNSTTFSSLVLPTSTTFIVQNSPNDTQTSRTLYSGTDGSATTTRYAFSIPYTQINFDIGNNSSDRISLTPITAGNTSVGAHIWMGLGQQGTSQKFNRDGTTMGTGTAATTTSAFSCPLIVGAGPALSVSDSSCQGTIRDFFSGTIGEIVIYNAALSTINYQLIEGYLACKWGLQSNLPAGHPYKSSCPTAGTTPSSVTGLAAWYDASDITQFTFNSQKVSGWSDKTSNAKNLAQGTSANQPTYTSNCTNSLGCLTFDGTASYLASNDTSYSSNLLFPASTVFIVQNANNDTQAAATLYSSLSGAATQQYYVKLPNASNVYFDFGNNSNDRLSAATTSFSSVATHVWMALGNQTSGVIRFERDGTRISSTSAGSATTSFSCALYIGALSNCGSAASGFFGGTIEEILVYNTFLSQAEYQYVEGYLACKWGTQSILATTHPYYSSCPTSTANLTLSNTVSPTGLQIPGTDLTYTTTYSNSGIPDYNPVITAPMPSQCDFKVGSATSNQSTNGLSVTIAYSNDGGSTYTYTPVSQGGTAPLNHDRNVTHVRWSFTGALSGGTANNTGTLAYACEIW